MAEKLFDVIKKDHQEVKGIFEKILQTKKSDQREKLLDQLKSEIIPHMTAEEKILYRDLKDECSECKEDVLEAYEEHHAARLILDELMDLSADDETFHAKASVLQEMVSHHIKEEESTIFKDIKKHMKSDQVEEILQKFEKEKEKAKGKAH
ncbi:MAG: hemerythrin domain-containing protein [Syntrophotaleaceae bacterium]